MLHDYYFLVRYCIVIKHAFSFLYRCENTFAMDTKRDSFFLNKNENKKNGFDRKRENKDDFHKKNENKGFNKKKDFNNKRQEQFNKNRGIEEKQEGEKKPFDKKAYRLKKYSKKYKLEQWEEQRKKKMLREYQKDLKNDPMAGSYKPKGFDEDVTDSNEVGRFVRHPDLIENENTDEKVTKFTKKDPFQKAKEHFNKVKEEKLQKQQEKEKAMEEKRQKLQEYKKKKQERFKKLSRKTKKGQPVMTGRLELLLEKIQKG